jgi:hypothetical protein
MSERSTEQPGRTILWPEESLTAYEAEPDELMIRDSVIKRFEFTRELGKL